MTYPQITLEERYQIASLRAVGAHPAARAVSATGCCVVRGGSAVVGWAAPGAPDRAVTGQRRASQAHRPLGD